MHIFWSSKIGLHREYKRRPTEQKKQNDRNTHTYDRNGIKEVKWSVLGCIASCLALLWRNKIHIFSLSFFSIKSTICKHHKMTWLRAQTHTHTRQAETHISFIRVNFFFLFFDIDGPKEMNLHYSDGIRFHPRKYTLIWLAYMQFSQFH